MRKTILNAKWWAAAGIRTIKTMAETALATIGCSALIETVNWPIVFSSTALSGILTLLSCLAGLPEVSDHDGK